MEKNHQIQEQREQLEQKLKETLKQGDILTVDRGINRELFRFNRWNGPYISSFSLDTDYQDGLANHGLSPLFVTHVNTTPVAAL
jgi:hypothetical protein